MSLTLPPDVATTLYVGGSANRLMRFYAFESVRFTAEFRDARTKELVEVAGVTFGLKPPGSLEEIVPEGFAVEMTPGIWACAIVPATPGTWQAVARCASPSGSVTARSFVIEALPAGTPPPPTTLVTDDTGLFLLLSDDGALISV